MFLPCCDGFFLRNVPLLKHFSEGAARDAGTAVGQGEGKRVEGNRNLYNTKKLYQLCLFLFSKIVDLKNTNRNYRKPFLIFWVLA